MRLPDSAPVQGGRFGSRQASGTGRSRASVYRQSPI